MAIDLISYNRLGRVFVGANVSAKIITVVGTAMTGGILYNPVGSGRILVVQDAGFSWTTIPPSAQSIGLAMGAANITIPASTTVATTSVTCANGSGGTGAGKFYDVATLPVAPVAVRWLAGAAWITGGTGEAPYLIIDEINGALAVVPGASLSFCMIGGTGPTGLGHMTWVEVDQ